jgi:hypothetical protein
MTYYTITEIHRAGMLLNNKLKPYIGRANVAKVVANWPSLGKATPWGQARLFSEAQIKAHNAKMQSYNEPLKK